MPEWSCLPAQTGCPSSRTVPVKEPVRELVGALEQETANKKRTRKVRELRELARRKSQVRELHEFARIRERIFFIALICINQRNVFVLIIRVISGQYLQDVCIQDFFRQS